MAVGSSMAAGGTGASPVVLGSQPGRWRSSTWFHALRRGRPRRIAGGLTAVGVRQRSVVIVDVDLRQSAEVNEAKGASTPDVWLPPNRRSRCRYAITWIAIKPRWDLSITDAEHRALVGLLELCPPSDD